MVLNPALHSAAGHVSEIGGKHTGSNSSVRDKDIPQQQSGSGSETGSVTGSVTSDKTAGSNTEIITVYHA